MDEEEKRKYIRLRSKMYTIKANVNFLEAKNNELISLLNNGLKINKEIAEKDGFDYLSNNITKTKQSIEHIINIANNKI